MGSGEGKENIDASDQYINQIIEVILLFWKKLFPFGRHNSILFISGEARFSYSEYQMITQTINSKSKLADYKKYHDQAKLHIQELESKLENRALSLNDYKRDLSRRLATHDKEFALALRDAALLLTSAKKQVVELFPIN